MYNTWHRDRPERSRRNNRSKNGCLTCRQRKVRCDENRPRCGPCWRLERDCTWRVPEASPTPTSNRNARPSGTPSDLSSPRRTVMNPPIVRPEEVFDFAQFLWGECDAMPPLSALSTDEDSLGIGSMSSRGQQESDVASQAYPQSLYSSETGQLIRDFQYSEAPPLLSSVETPSRWKSMRTLLFSLTSTSMMVQYAVLAFSSLRIHHEQGRTPSEFESFYDKCQQEILCSLLEHDTRIEIIGAKVEHLLAALFLLSYIDLVANRTKSAHANLQKAFRITKGLDYGKLNATEATLIAWIRLLDARAVSAGGEGLFLREERASSRSSRSVSPSEKDAETIVAELLSDPSLKFFQRTQSFMGRITELDQWHRSRGTVEDETEVMVIAAQIRLDIHSVYRHRHPLLDLAVAGKVEAPIVTQAFAKRITKSSRVALANYHAAFIHLHRVAYRHLPCTKDVSDAMESIRQMTHMMVEAQNLGESLPVNMLWPLLMWGSEEKNTDERVWILSTIRDMSDAVNNAAITADVLQEVLRRQDDTRQRVDIRTVMHDMFQSCFAIV